MLVGLVALVPVILMPLVKALEIAWSSDTAAAVALYVSPGLIGSQVTREVIVATPFGSEVVRVVSDGVTSRKLPSVHGALAP